jgi:tellurite resistance protein TehA-like permease
MSDNVIYGLGGLMFFQAYVTVRIVRKKSYTSTQKRRQLLFVWLVPFIGAAIALAALATDDKNPGRPA